jgi:catalase
LELGSIRVINQVEESDAVQREAVQRKVIFDPTRLVDGIELSNDPLLPARSAIYSIAYKRRNP